MLVFLVETSGCRSNAEAMQKQIVVCTHPIFRSILSHLISFELRVPSQIGRRSVQGLMKMPKLELLEGFYGVGAPGGVPGSI